MQDERCTLNKLRSGLERNPRLTLTLEPAVYEALAEKSARSGRSLADTAREILRAELLGADDVPQLLGRTEGVAELAEHAIRAGMTNEAAANHIRKNLPGANTTEASVRWYRSRMRKRGENVPTQVEARRNFKD